MQAFPLAIRRDVGEADCVGVRDGRRQRPAGWRRRNCSACGRNGAVKAHHEIFLAVADEAADPEDLAATKLEIDVMHRPAAKLRVRDERLDGGPA